MVSLALPYRLKCETVIIICSAYISYCKQEWYAEKLFYSAHLMLWKTVRLTFTCFHVCRWYIMDSGCIIIMYPSWSEYILVTSIWSFFDGIAVVKEWSSSEKLFYLCQINHERVSYSCMLDPALGAWFITKFLSLNQVGVV